MESPHIIKSVGLGSCVAVILYDSKVKIGGLAHIMLPYSIKTEDEKLRRYEVEKQNLTSQPLNFSTSAYQSANTAIPALLEVMKKNGTDIQKIVAKMAGGARMFSHYEGLSTGIGEQNINNIKALLRKNHIGISAAITAGVWSFTLN